MPDHPDRTRENDVLRAVERVRPGSMMTGWTIVRAVVYLLHRLRRLEKRVRELEGD